MVLKRKVISCFLCCLFLLYCFLGFVPLRGYAVVPVSLVESALASYTVSAGYKWYSDGSGSEMSQSITNLYNTWLQVADPVAAIKTLEEFAENDYVYLDSSGQIVIRKAAADMFQQFSDWIETQYSVPVGSDTPTEVVAASGALYSNSDGTISALGVSMNGPTFLDGSQVFYTSSVSIGTIRIRGTDYPCYYCNTSSNTVFLTQFVSSRYVDIYRAGFISSDAICYLDNGSWAKFGIAAITQDSIFEASSYQNTVLVSCTLPVSTVRPSNVSASTLTKVEGTGVAGLGASLAQAVADVVGQATDDDAVVIGVGAGVGATAQDIASLVADGIKAGTLDPSVSITAEAVIDTPVQPYPDIDGLGLPSLGAELVSRFPFCIPWDFVDVVKLFSAEPVAPRFQFDIVPNRVKSFCGISQSTTIDLNMGDPKFEKIGMFCRWGSLIGFCWGLVLLTKRMIWTA